MNLKKISAVSVFIIAIFILVFINTTFSQPQYSISLKATGPGSSVSKDTICTFGWDVTATYCRDLALGEDVLPPPPVSGVWDFRFVDPRGFNDACTDMGLHTDIRPWILNTTITDTFQTSIMLGASGSSYTLSWPPITNPSVQSASLQDLFGGIIVNVDMKTTNTKVVPTSMLQLYIIVTTQKQPDAVKEENEMPKTFGLEQNYPNPFNPTTNVKFAVPAKSNVEIVVFDMLGRKVRTLVSENLSANVYSVEWNGRNDNGTALASGIYNIRMTANSELGNTFTDVRKVVLMK
jgi:hypothetical protein